MIHIFRLARVPNLLIIALSMYLVKYFLFIEYIIGSDTQGLSINIVRELANIEYTLSPFEFFLLVLSVLLITAAGYLINDYFDVEADEINREQGSIIGKTFGAASVLSVYIVLNIAGTALGFYLAYLIGNPSLGVIHLFSAGLLWFYSTSYKRMFLIGNVVVACLCALVPLIPAVFEPNVYNTMHSIFGFTVGYAVFAFVITFIRELIKDVEDIEGDRASGCRTFAVTAGINVSKWLIISVSLMLLAAMGFIQNHQYAAEDFLSFWYFLFMVQLPIAAMIFYVAKAGSEKEFRIPSAIAKGVMVTGILSMVVFYYSIL